MNEAIRTGEKRGEEKPSLLRSIYDWLDALAMAIAVVAVLFLFVFKIATVFGSSMVPTLAGGDRLFVSDLFYEPKAGDIVVLSVDGYPYEPIIKRVIALEGQTVDIDFDAGIVYVDGTALDEPYTNTPTNERETLPLPVTVQPGTIFVLGDNRNASSDSRNAERVGLVDTRRVLGKAYFRLFPLQKLGGLY